MTEMAPVIPLASSDIPPRPAVQPEWSVPAAERSLPVRLLRNVGESALATRLTNANLVQRATSFVDGVRGLYRSGSQKLEHTEPTLFASTAAAQESPLANATVPREPETVLPRPPRQPFGLMPLDSQGRGVELKSNGNFVVAVDGSLLAPIMPIKPVEPRWVNRREGVPRSTRSTHERELRQPTTRAAAVVLARQRREQRTRNGEDSRMHPPTRSDMARPSVNSSRRSSEALQAAQDLPGRSAPRPLSEDEQYRLRGR